MTPHCLLDMFSLGEQNACTFVLLDIKCCVLLMMLYPGEQLKNMSLCLIFFSEQYKEKGKTIQ